MLFAAGFGTRMGALTATRPKPLVQVAGKPLIDHAMKIVREVDPKTIVVNAHYKAEQIAGHFADTSVAVSVEHPEILDTGGGLKAALPLLKTDPVFTMNTDSVWKGPNPLKVLEDAWTDDMQALLLCLPKSNAVGHSGTGDFDIDQNGYARWGTETVYSGVQIIRTKIVSNNAQSTFSLRKVWEDLVSQNALHAVIYPGLWCDVGHPDGIALAEAMLERDDV